MFLYILNNGDIYSSLDKYNKIAAKYAKSVIFINKFDTYKGIVKPLPVDQVNILKELFK